jgi:HSP20 family molecular chaperone IbpA
MRFDEDIFDEIDKMFKEEMRRIRKIITELTRVRPDHISDLEKRGEPLVFGFTYRWGTGMKKPEVKFFGNVKPVQPYGIKISEDATPVYDVIDKGDHYEIVVELAGAKKDDVSVEVVDDSLDIKAKTPYKKYSVKIRLPSGIDIDNMKAKLNNGILVITVPKRKDRVSSKKIDIEEE